MKVLSQSGLGNSATNHHLVSTFSSDSPGARAGLSVAVNMSYEVGVIALPLLLNALSNKAPLSAFENITTSPR